MIIDLCKPINDGESRTVRIIMTVHEARELLATVRPAGSSGHDLLNGIQRAIERNDHGLEGKPLDVEQPLFNHTRADGFYDPCPICVQLMSREDLIKVIQDAQAVANARWRTEEPGR